MALENTIRLPYLSHGLRDQSIGSSLEWSSANSAKTVSFDWISKRLILPFVYRSMLVSIAHQFKKQLLIYDSAGHFRADIAVKCRILR